MAIKIEYENEIPKLRFASIYCPECDSKFDALENGTDEHGFRLADYIDLKYGKYKCPYCKYKFTTRDEDLIMNEEEGL